MSADPLQQDGSGTATPDSGASDWNWDAVDREIERLAAAPPRDAHNSSEEDEEEEEAEGAQLLGDGPAPASAAATSRLQDRLARRRLVLLVCASVLSVGSHYSTYTLGPIKKSLGTTEGGFAALVSSFELLNTVTPLLSGFLVPRYGAATCGLVATGAVLVGQLIVCVSSSREGGIGNNVGGTVLGLLVFGSGTAPLAVVQESIILKHNSASSRFVARSVAAGLLLGKSASFAAGWSSQRLYTMSPRLPFITAASLSLFSFLACVLYACVERSTVRLRAHTSQVTESTSRKPVDPPEPEPADPSAHRPLHLSSLARFGDPFWWYLAVCVLAGSWYTTQHLSTHLVQATYGGISQADASGTASLLLGTPIVLYPLVGWTVDKHPQLLATLWLLVPSLIATTFFLLLLLSPVVPPLVALLPAALGIGSGPLLVVLVVPRIVQRHQAPTALGAHKSLEMAGEREGEELLGRKERLEMRRGTRALRAAAATVVASWACFVWNVVHG
ncbi:major facilitator superfamily domain-containing protein [Rhodotorula diobovata]|uniref:Lysosomal dipeptide transporter MFSD1 n=1 Tax=Rhodotorula diobovata TaxID=5288 RepID=A0A5C5FYN2_9BASI|nr:major facilitator superfamily domain-containing protein [Rhodotorula diobovata]